MAGVFLPLGHSIFHNFQCLRTHQLSSLRASKYRSETSIASQNKMHQVGRHIISYSQCDEFSHLCSVYIFFHNSALNKAPKGNDVNFVTPVQSLKQSNIILISINMCLGIILQKSVTKVCVMYALNKI